MQNKMAAIASKNQLGLVMVFKTPKQDGLLQERRVRARGLQKCGNMQLVGRVPHPAYEAANPKKCGTGECPVPLIGLE
jgi:hypothetical protein